MELTEVEAGAAINTVSTDKTLTQSQQIAIHAAQEEIKNKKVKEYTLKDLKKLLEALEASKAYKAGSADVVKLCLTLRYTFTAGHVQTTTSFEGGDLYKKYFRALQTGTGL